MVHKGSCHCGAVAYEVEGVDPKGNAIAAINVRCLEGVDLDKLEITPYDGRSL